MRVCILTRSDLFPAHHGAAVKIVQTAHHLAAETDEPCFVLTSDRDAYWVFHEGNCFKRLYPTRWRAAQEWPGEWLNEKLPTWLCKKIGYPKEEFFLYLGQFDPSWLIRAIAIGIEESADVFQAEFPGFGLPASMAARILGHLRGWTGGRRPQSSIVEHNVEFDRLTEFGNGNQAIRRMEMRALKSVDHVVAVSAEDRRKLTANGLPPSKITVIPLGVDVLDFKRASGQGSAIRHRYGISENAIVLFFHGTLHYWPNAEAVRFIVDQLMPLLDSSLEFVMMIVGMSPPVNLAREGLIFPGPVDDLAAHVDAADICICPLFAGGGTRLKLLEYLAAGKPTLSTAKGAEGINHHGAIAMAETAADMARRIHHWAANPLDAKRFGEAGRLFARQYDWAAVTRHYLSLYRGYGGGKDYSISLPAVDAHLPKRQPSKPLTLLLLINRGCNLRCEFCDLWDNPEEMSLHQAEELFDEALTIGVKTVVITGGEPTMHPDWAKIVGAAKLRGMTVNMTTNGALIEKKWVPLTKSGLDSLSFSIDGMSNTHDRIRGVEGSFEKTLSSLKRVLSETDLHCSVYFTATGENVFELIEVFDLATSLGASFDFWPVNDAPQLAICSPKAIRAWREAVSYIASKSEAVASRRLFYDQAIDYHAGAFKGKSLRCLGFVDQLGVKYDGSLIPCCVWGGDGLVVGNVFETPLSILWHSDAVRRSRGTLYEDGCSVGCYNHSLYEFTESTGESFVLGQSDEASLNAE